MLPFPHDTWLLPITDHSQIGDAKRRITAAAAELGFDTTPCGEIAIVASELATNIFMHAKTGYLLVRRFEESGGLEVMAVDRGCGMEDTDQCLRDGYSTAGTAGNGLGAVRRMCDQFDIYSRPAQGSVVLARFHRAGPPAASRFTIGAVCLPIHGEEVCGDAWAVHPTASGGLRVVVVDGLGHGIDAAQAACQALRIAEANLSVQPTGTIELAHRGLASTVGAAMAVCDVDPRGKTVRFAGIGNISSVMSNSQGQRSMVSHNGIVGHNLRKTQEFSYPWESGSVLILHSDGLSTKWDLEARPGLQSRHPSVIAAVLHRDFCRGHDDATVLVIRENA